MTSEKQELIIDAPKSLTEKRKIAAQKDALLFEVAYEKAKNNNELKSGTIVNGLWEIMNALHNKKNDRALMFTLQYYGMVGEVGKTLNEIGQDAVPQLTRERIRQMVKSVREEMLVYEKKHITNISDRPHAKVRLWFGRQCISSGQPHVHMSTLLAEFMATGFSADNTSGLSAVLSGADIHTITMKDGIFLYQGTFNRMDAEQDIKAEKKRERLQATAKRRAKLSKTVTYVPPKVREDVMALSNSLGLHLNRFYELVLEEFGNAKPWVGHKEYFEKTQSWKARTGESDWVQTGLLIKNEVFKISQKRSKKAKVSLMAFIARALAWSTSDDQSAVDFIEKTKAVAAGDSVEV